MLLHERARGARVVEVDVREQEVVDVLQLEPARGEALLQRGDRRGRAAVVQREALLRLDDVAADGSFDPLEAQVDRVCRRHGRGF